MRAPVISPLGIVYYPASVLRETCAPIGEIDEGVLELAGRLSAIMDAASGLGLAAPQIGVPLRAFATNTLLDDEGKPLVLINPEIVERSETTRTMDEGCLSLPGMMVSVTRPETVVVRYRDLLGAERVVMAQGLSASCVQHEIDHLDGALILDGLSRLKRERYDKRLAKMMKG